VFAVRQDGHEEAQKVTKMEIKNPRPEAGEDRRDWFLLFVSFCA
jgi:hypothetical protein